MELTKGRPINEENRQTKELEAYDLLDKLNIEYERIDHESADTMELCKEIDEVLAPAVICKNLFLTDKHENNFYLLMLREDKQFKTSDISHQIGSTRLQFASREKMEEYLNTTPGSATVLSLMYDHENKVKLLIDKDIIKRELLGCHPMVNTSSIRVRTEDILTRFLGEVNHDYLLVEA